jgi:hypothetical protein
LRERVADEVGGERALSFALKTLSQLTAFGGSPPCPASGRGE